MESQTQSTTSQTEKPIDSRYYLTPEEEEELRKDLKKSIAEGLKYIEEHPIFPRKK